MSEEGNKKMDFIKSALLLLNENGGNLSQTAAELNMSKATLMRWRNKHDIEIEGEIIESFKEKKEKKKKKKKLVKKNDIEPVTETTIENYDYKEQILEPYIETKSLSIFKAIQIRNKTLDKIEMYLDKLTPENILKQDLNKLSTLAKMAHEIGTGENLDDPDRSKTNFYTVINQQILKQQNDE